MRFALSRYAVIRVRAGALVAEAADSTHPVILDPSELELLSHLATPGEVDAAAPACVARLRQARVIVDEATWTAEQASPWGYHERLFLERTRPPVGTGEPRVPAFAPPAVVAVGPEDPTVSLPEVDLRHAERVDPPFAAVQEQRRTVRHFRSTLSPDQLGKILYRCGRISDLVTLDGGFTLASRPYPGGGGLYELELCPIVRAVDGVDPGAYRYAADRHQLVRFAGSAGASAELLAGAARAMAVDAPPPVLIVIAARPARLSFKYGGLSHALALKDAGVLLGLLALTATAVGLGACPIGAGSWRGFAEATGASSEELVSVAELALGRPA